MTTFWPQTLVDWAQIFSALGTCGAVIVSLWLSIRRPKPDLLVTASIREVFEYGWKQPLPRYLTLDVVNVGTTPAILRSFGWKNGWNKRVHLYQKLDGPNDGIVSSSPIPIRLEAGESAQYYISLNGAKNWLTNIAERGFFGEELTTRKSLNSIRLFAATSTGTVTGEKLPTTLLDEMWKYQEKYVSSKSGTAG